MLCQDPEEGKCRDSGMGGKGSYQTTLESQVCGGGGYVLCPGKPLDHWNREGRRPEAGRLGRGSSSEGPSGKGADDLVDQDGMLGTQR